MKIYNVIIENRHSDTIAIPFTDLETAKMYARSEGRKYAMRHPEDYVEEKTPKGWLLYITYSCEGDCVWITEHDISTQKAIVLESGVSYVSKDVIAKYGIDFIKKLNNGTTIIK